MAPDDRQPEHRFGAVPVSALPEDAHPAARWLDARLPLLSGFRREYVAYPMPRNLNYLWNFGAFATIALAVLVLSGIFLAINYTPTVAGAFASVEAIDRQVSSGWLVRALHMGGVSMFFAVLYIHMARSLCYGSYKAPREMLWLTGMALLIMVMGAAFAGYVLPWGQMSYWGATVATNALGAVPVVGQPLAAWLEGGPSLGDVALHRIYVLHFVIAFSAIGVVVLHVMALHVTGSNNPTGVEPRGPQDTVPFHPYYTAKDGLGVVLFALVFAVLIFFLPGWLTEADNYIPANPLATPAEIYPEWYFAPFYAILRAVPSKLGGLLLSVGSLLLVCAVPWLDRSPVRSARFRPLYRWLVLLLFVDFVALGVAGHNPPQGIWLLVSRLATLYWYLHFLVLLPLLPRVERPRALPAGPAA